MASLEIILEQKSKQIEIVVGDGHCLLHAFAMSVEAEKNHSFINKGWIFALN